MEIFTCHGKRLQRDGSDHAPPSISQRGGKDSTTIFSFFFAFSVGLEEMLFSFGAYTREHGKLGLICFLAICQVFTGFYGISFEIFGYLLKILIGLSIIIDLFPVFIFLNYFLRSSSNLIVFEIF